MVRYPHDQYRPRQGRRARIAPERAYARPSGGHVAPLPRCAGRPAPSVLAGGVRAGAPSRRHRRCGPSRSLSGASAGSSYRAPDKLFGLRSRVVRIPRWGDGRGAPAGRCPAAGTDGQARDHRTHPDAATSPSITGTHGPPLAGVPALIRAPKARSRSTRTPKPERGRRR